MNGKKIRLIMLAVMTCLLMSLFICGASADGVTATFQLAKNPYAEEMLVAGSPYAMPGVSFDHQSGEYLGAQTVITAKELLKKIQNGNEFATAFAVKLGLGLTKDQVTKNLNKLVKEYDQQIAKGNKSFEEPRFVINGVNIVMNKNVEKIRLTLNADGTYSATMNGDQIGYRASIMIDADASVTIVYDEAGQTQIERRVANGKPTDFVIALDVSGSMRGDRGDAMFKALRVVLEEVLHEENNTVSIVFWAEDSAIMQLDVDHTGVKQVFSGKDGVTLNKLFDASMVDSNGNESGMSLADATIHGIERLYRTGSVTEPDKGLTKALDLLNALTTGEGRNVGVMLFTDGTVVPGDWYTSEETIERNTVALEKQMAEQFGATLVNVSIGDEYDVESYERYLDPNSPNYYDKSQILMDKVLYYNIPKLSNQELADKVSEMFEVAFETISMDYKALQTETITDGVLAAYGAQLIESIPAGFELVRLKGENESYVVNGVDENGNTTIQFDLNKIISGQDQVLSYCVIPTAGAGVSDIGVNAYMTRSETVLYVRPVDRLNYLEEQQIIKVELNGVEPDNEDPLRPDLPEVENANNRYTWMNEFKPFAEQRRNANVNKNENRISGKDEWKYLENFIDTFLNAGFPLNEVKEYAKALAECKDDRMREMILMMFSSDIVTVEYYPNGRLESNGTMKYGSYETVSNGKITVRYIPFQNRGTNIELRTIFHELGHAMDSYVAGKDKDVNDVNDLYSVSSKKKSSQDRVKGIKADVEAAVKNTVDGYVKNQFPNTSQEKSELYSEYVTYMLINHDIPNADLKKYDQKLSQQEKSVLDNIYNSAKRDFNQAAYTSSSFIAADKKDAYKFIISDVLGGITNNNLVDSCGHDILYWYKTDNNGNGVFKDWTICEIWAEYTESVLVGRDNIDDVMNSFFPSFGQNELRDDMHSKIADSLNK